MDIAIFNWRLPMKLTFVTSAVFCVAASAAIADHAGYSPFSVNAEHHGRGMIGAIWYPANDDGRAFDFADSPVFYGVPVTEEATVRDGTFPVVLLSHGMGGNIRSLAWLATDLAEQGVIVVSVNHPNSTWGDFDMIAGLQHGTRVQDLSLALDTLWADPKFADHLDGSRVMAAGFSYGGWTALSMGGLRGNHAGYVAHCDAYSAASVHCKNLMDEGIELSEIDDATWNADYSDARVTHVTAIDPGLIWGLSGADIQGLVGNVNLIGLGQRDDRLLAADFDLSGLSALLPDAHIDNLAPAMHFTALPLCKPMAAAILIEEQDDPVCTDPDGTNREAVHDAIVARILADLAG
jgi:predicted dienelactone hydrolase